MIDRDGVGSVSMRELGDAVGLSRSAVYRHFASKEDLLAAIAAEDFGAFERVIHDIIGMLTDPVAVLETLLKTCYSFGTGSRAHYRLMFGTEWNKALYPELHKAAVRVFDLVAGCVEKAQAAGRIIQTPPRLLTATVTAFIHGLVELGFAGHAEPEKSMDDPQRLIDAFFGLLKTT
jgi:AcrR family transcriptional regulator